MSGVAAPGISFPNPQLDDHILGQSALLVGSYRVLAHVSLMLRSTRAAKEARLPLALAAACVAADLGLTGFLRRSRREWFLLRLAHDAVEAGVWAASAHGHPTITESANLFPVGLSVEAAYRAGRRTGPLRLSDLRCLLPTAITAFVAGHARRRRGAKPRYGFAGWGLAGTVAGFALGRNQRAAERRLVEGWRDHTGPRVEAAWWLGQHDLATDERSTRSPHHLTKELLMMESQYGSTRARDVRSTLEARKQEVRDLTRQFGDYLGRAVIGRTVSPPGAWSVRLTPEQVVMLHSALPPAGKSLHVIEVLNEVEARRPGGEVQLRCGDLSIVLPAAAAPERWRGDAAAVGFLFGALTKLYPAVPELGGVPPWAVIPPALIDVMGAFSYKRDAPNPDPSAEDAAAQAGAPLQVALLSGLLLAAGSGATARSYSKGGVQQYPGGEGLWGFHILLARYYAHLSQRQRAWACLGSVSIASTAVTLRWLRTGERLDAASAVEAGLAALVPFTSGFGLGGRLLQQSFSADRAMSDASVRALDAARAEGAEAEARRLLQWIRDAEAVLAAIPDIPTDEAAVLRTRFEEVRVWLANRT